MGRVLLAAPHGSYAGVERASRAVEVARDALPRGLQSGPGRPAEQVAG